MDDADQLLDGRPKQLAELQQALPLIRRTCHPLGQPSSQNFVLDLEKLDLSDKIIRAALSQHEIHCMKQLGHHNLRNSLPHKGMTTFSNSAGSCQCTRKRTNFARPVNPAVREFVTFQMWHPWVTLICPNRAEKLSNSLISFGRNRWRALMQVFVNRVLIGLGI